MEGFSTYVKLHVKGRGFHQIFHVIALQSLSVEVRKKILAENSEAENIGNIGLTSYTSLLDLTNIK